MQCIARRKAIAGVFAVSLLFLRKTEKANKEKAAVWMESCFKHPAFSKPCHDLNWLPPFPSGCVLGTGWLIWLFFYLNWGKDRCCSIVYPKHWFPWNQCMKPMHCRFFSTLYHPVSQLDISFLAVWRSVGSCQAAWRITSGKWETRGHVDLAARFIMTGLGPETLHISSMKTTPMCWRSGTWCSYSSTGDAVIAFLLFIYAFI